MSPLIPKAVSGLAALALAVDTIPTNLPDAIGRLSLDGALVIAVGVLWRAIGKAQVDNDARIAAKEVRIAEKDAQIIAMTSKVTEVMTLVLESVKEFRGELKEVISDLRDEINPRHRPDPR
jgi:hypothetical protein